MIPIQDVVPSGQAPIVTISLIVINTLVFFAQWLAPGWGAPLVQPFTTPGPVHLAASALFLWLFGDNVEARIGRLALVALYLVCSLAGLYSAGLLAGGRVLPLGAACAISGVLGAYFVILPASRILVLIPFPLRLTEVPALFFLGLWGLLHLATFAAPPARTPRLLGALAVAFAAGAAIGVMTRRPVRW